MSLALPSEEKALCIKKAGIIALQHLSSESQRRADVSDVFIVAWVGKLIVDFLSSYELDTLKS